MSEKYPIRFENEHGSFTGYQTPTGETVVDRMPKGHVEKPTPYVFPKPFENIKRVEVCLWCYPQAIALLGIQPQKNKEYVDRICKIHVEKMRKQADQLPTKKIT